MTPGSVNIAQAVALPTPRIVATPEGGMDYETAVFANIYEQVNPCRQRDGMGTCSLAVGGFTPEEWPGRLLVISTGSGSCGMPKAISSPTAMWSKG